MHKLPLLRGLREVIGWQPYPNYFFGEADSQTQTHDISLWVEGTCHCTKAQPLFVLAFAEQVSF
jgi:hypothetical protein